MSNLFGGSWTEEKIKILSDYTSAYLFLMNGVITKNNYNWQLLYFDGFAGSGDVTVGKEANIKTIKGAAKEVLSIVRPRVFDRYYFVEKDSRKQTLLKEFTKEIRDQISELQNVKINVEASDCNEKLLSMAKYLMTNKKNVGETKIKTLAFLDPFGMSVDWSSIQNLKGLDIDIWILIPSGIGINRMLAKDGDIAESWKKKLATFFGLTFQQIDAVFYDEVKQYHMFEGETTEKKKKSKANDRIIKTYTQQLMTVFSEVSKPYLLLNSQKSLMYHFVLCSNNARAIKIANQLVDKQSKTKSGHI